MSRVRQLAAALLLLLALAPVAPRSAGASPAVPPAPRRPDEQHPVRTRFVLDLWLKALGGRSKLLAVRSMYVKAILVSSGQIGSLENWQAADGRYKTVVNLGDHEFITVCDGRSGWTASDGAAQDLDAGALAAAITRSYLGSYSQFFPDRLPGSVEWVREDPDAYVLQLLPSGGVPITFYLDKTTGLPIRHEMLDGERTLTFYYLEWQDYGALKTWKRGRQTTGADAPDLSVTAQDISWNPTLDPKIFQKPAQ